MSQVLMLYRLQEIDTEYREKKLRLTEVLRAQKETEILLAARRRVETAVTQLKKWRVQHKDLSLELESLNTKAKRSEDRLYSGNVKNPKELSDLQNEIQALGRRRNVLEDEILEVMMKVEDAEAEQHVADDALAKIETQWQRAQTGLKQEQNELALRLHVLTGQRQQQVALISAENLTLYNNLSQKRGGVAVAKLQENMCLGCRLTVSANKVKAVNEGQLVSCGGCGRILCPQV